MIYMAVDPKYQRQGVGGSLLKNVLHLAKTKFTRLELAHLEVFEDSPIIGLLKKQGFKKLFHQDNYVKFPEGFKARELFEINLR